MTRLTLLCSVLFIVTPTATAFSAEDLPNDLHARATASIVRIAIEYIDVNRVMYAAPHGYGTYISPDGSILTAAHVVMPASASLANAVAYRVTVQEWNPKGGWQPPFATITSSDLPSRVLLDDRVVVGDCQRNTVFPAMPCVKDALPREIDYALLHVPTTPPHAFLDVAGPYDEMTVSLLQLMPRLFVLSQFDESGILRLADVSHPLLADRYHIETSQTRSFIRGVSGSPLLVFAKVPSAHVFVAGIVVEQAQYEATQRTYPDAHVVFTDEFLGRAAPRFVATRAVAPFNCGLGLPMVVKPLLDNYLVVVGGTVADNTFASIRDCFKQYVEWDTTSTVLAFTRRNATANALDDVASLPTFRQAETPLGFDANALTKNDDKRLRSFLEQTYSATIDPLSLLQQASAKLAAGCANRREECVVERCAADCVPGDTACAEIQRACDLRAAAARLACEERQRAAVTACARTQTERFMLLARTITKARAGMMTLEETRQLRTTAFGAVILEREDRLRTFLRPDLAAR